MAKKLTDKYIRNLTGEDAGKKFDGDGLYLLVKTDGGKYWRHKYYFNRKEKHRALGVYKPGNSGSVSLANARAAHQADRDVLKDGLDPSQERKREKRQELLDAENTFETIAKEWWEHQKGRWTEAHAGRVWSSIEGEVVPSRVSSSSA